MNEVLKTIGSRRSIRSYSDEAVPDEVIDTIMQAALEAPSARNLQPWHFSVVTNRDLLDELDACMGGDGTRSVIYKAPLFIVISAPVERTFFAKIDCGIAVENMALAAESLGYGNVIIGAARIAFTGKHAEELRKKFCIPEGYEFIIGLAVGKALASKDAHEQHPEKISYIR